MTGIAKVLIVDYGMGNLGSVQNALDYLEADYQVSSTPKVIASADALILPGVGSFRLATQTLQKQGIDDAIREAVSIKGKKILGICLGMQLLGTRSSEDGESEGFGFIGAGVDRFTELETDGQKIPHVGFNAVRSAAGSILFSGLSEASDFYFVHSYRMLPDALPGVTAICNYGAGFLAAYEHENIFATQFHPEKSQTSGLSLLSNFLSC
jgi:glutamine amidotransferase